MAILKFPENFLWGCATAAYQIEGGIENSDWSKIYPAGLACGHYNRYSEDFDLLKKLNQNAYRFSIEWSRIEPREGQFDEKELEYYQTLLESLKSRGIKTMVTLHHFTNPAWLAEEGGWTNSKVVFYFSRFAEVLFERYSHLVDFWITINEPTRYLVGSYWDRTMPTQRKSLFLALKAAANQISSHKKIYKIFHQREKKCRIGIAKDNHYFEPFNPTNLLDRISARFCRYFYNEFFLDRIKNHLDFIGLNYYLHAKIKYPILVRNENTTVSDIAWEIYPEGIYHTLKELKKYNLPVYITENGVADAEDKLRKNFIKDHLFWVHKAIKEGIDVRGYFHWSLIDNFEWDKGFGPRFGLIEIDYKTLERKPRPSAYYYAEICKNNSLDV